jgi:hypothetical protein
MRVAFKHIRSSRNLGDTWCSPYDHLPHFRDQYESSAHDLDEPTPPVDAVIFGGGKIMGSLAKKLSLNDFTARHRIAWGVSTVQKFWFSPKYRNSFRKMSLVGSRDWGDTRFPFVPCSSCMSPAFDEEHVERHEVVAYLHHWRSPEMGIKVPDSIPCMDNTATSFKEAIDFIGSGSTVVSNSYHGVFWGLLLGKKVLCLPFSNKFHNFRISPGYSSPNDWLGSLKVAKASDEMMPLCREATDAFMSRTSDLIES